MTSKTSADQAGRLVSVWHGTLRSVLISVLVVYVAWNIWWLTQGRLAPSLIVAIAEIPAPTTGGTRAVVSLLRGDLIESLRYNAMVIPLCTLLAVSLGQLGYQAFRQQRLRLATLLAWIWFTVLIAAWLAKLFIAEPA